VSYSVRVTNIARQQIVELAAASWDGEETGGILLGRGPGQDGIIIVEQAGEPGPAAERAPDFFLRDLPHAKALAAAAWERDRSVWVGEWHTHPGGLIHPSPRDLATYAGLLSAPELAFRALVAIIVVADPNWSTPRLLRAHA